MPLSKASGGAELIGEGRYARVYSLPNGNVLKLTSCGPSIDWLRQAVSQGSTNPYYPRVAAAYGCIHETPKTELHAFEVEALTERASWYWPTLLTTQVAAVRDLIAQAHARQPSATDCLFWRQLAPDLGSVIDEQDTALASALAELFSLIQSYRGAAYPDFTGPARRNIMCRPSGEWVLMDPVAALQACKPSARMAS